MLYLMGKRYLNVTCFTEMSESHTRNGPLCQCLLSISSIWVRMLLYSVLSRH